jgi:hypothetical protein
MCAEPVEARRYAPFDKLRAHIDKLRAHIDKLRAHIDRLRAHLRGVAGLRIE